MKRSKADVHGFSEGLPWGRMFEQARTIPPKETFLGFPDMTNDSDVRTYLASVGSLNTLQLNALYYLVSTLKNNNLWDKMQVMYPILGETGAKHQYNIMNPGTYNLAYTNTPTHTSQGIVFNGTNQYASTQFNPSSQGMNLYSNGQAIYHSSITAGGVVGVDQALDSYFLLSFVADISVTTCNLSGLLTNPLIVNGGNNIEGFILSSRLGNTPFAMINKKVVGKTIVAGSLPNGAIYIGARRTGGSPSNYVNGTCSFYCVHKGLTVDEALILNNTIHIYQTMLGRASKKVV